MSEETVPERRLIIRPDALSDMEDHAEYIGRNVSIAASVRFRSATVDALDYLLTMPYMGAPRFYKNPAIKGLRMFPMPEFNKYLVFYLTPEGNIEIVRVLHSSQDVDAILEAEILE